MEPDFYDQLTDSMFTYHPPTPEQVDLMRDQVQPQFQLMGELFNSWAPDGAAKTLALRKLHEARQAIHYAIVGGK